MVVSPDRDAPGVAVNLWVEVGSADETEGRTGFAHLFEHLMFQGSGNVASGEHMATIEALGGTINATTSTDRTNYFETVPRGALELALWLEADRFASLAITPENFEAQRLVVKEEKRQRYDNQPYGDLLELLNGQHFDTHHPYGHLTIGSMEDLDAAHLDDVARFFDAWYPASNLRLVLCGPVTVDEGLELADRYLGSLPSHDKPRRAAMAPTGGRPPASRRCAATFHTRSAICPGPPRRPATPTSRPSTWHSRSSPTARRRCCTARWCATETSPTRSTAAH
ncbi:insulinase family protein [Tessaracoccus defluvii]|uniref:Insulinase family protein n=1 Tax=Tessaracoccus defluvii TaxID=1285901 RepID=A0A7H0HAA7_9ACTN|nr:insulinase family protein [Tessaracoccus defluvii]